MFGAMWRLSKGYRFCPWRSPYLRWRIETYCGLDADRISPGAFWGFTLRNRRELIRFLRWADKMDTREHDG
jgi:hypothetical protein